MVEAVEAAVVAAVAAGDGGEVGDAAEDSTMTVVLDLKTAVGPVEAVDLPVVVVCVTFLCP